MEGLAFENYNAEPAMQLWAEGTIRRLNQSVRKKYKRRQTKKASKVLIDDSSQSESSESEEFEQQELIPELNNLE